MLPVSGRDVVKLAERCREGEVALIPITYFHLMELMVTLGILVNSRAAWSCLSNFLL